MVAKIAENNNNNTLEIFILMTKNENENTKQKQCAPLNSIMILTKTIPQSKTILLAGLHFVMLWFLRSHCSLSPSRTLSHTV